MWVVWVNVSITRKVLIASYFSMKPNLNYSENKCKHHFING